MNDLAHRDCIPCKAGGPPLTPGQIESLRTQLSGDWRVTDGLRLERDFRFKNFRQALDFTVRVGELAEAQGHHPDIFLAWGKAKLTLWTHKIGGLSENDFIFAAKVDRL